MKTRGKKDREMISKQVVVGYFTENIQVAFVWGTLIGADELKALKNEIT